MKNCIFIVLFIAPFVSFGQPLLGEKYITIFAKLAADDKVKTIQKETLPNGQKTLEYENKTLAYEHAIIGIYTYWFDKNDFCERYTMKLPYTVLENHIRIFDEGMKKKSNTKWIHYALNTEWTRIKEDDYFVLEAILLQRK